MPRSTTRFGLTQALDLFGKIMEDHLKAAAIATSTLVAGVVGWYLPLLDSYVSYFLLPFNPIPRLLSDAGVPRHALGWAVFPFDLLRSFLVSLPFAYLLTRLRPTTLIWYTAVAVLPFFVYLNGMLYSRGLLKLGNGTAQETIRLLLVLPCAVLLFRCINRSRRSNNSFKPKPLRGSA